KGVRAGAERERRLLEQQDGQARQPQEEQQKFQGARRSEVVPGGARYLDDHEQERGDQQEARDAPAPVQAPDGRPARAGGYRHDRRRSHGGPQRTTQQGGDREQPDHFLQAAEGNRWADDKPEQPGPGTGLQGVPGEEGQAEERRPAVQQVGGQGGRQRN